MQQQKAAVGAQHAASADAREIATVLVVFGRVDGAEQVAQAGLVFGDDRGTRLAMVIDHQVELAERAQRLAPGFEAGTGVVARILRFAFAFDAVGSVEQRIGILRDAARHPQRHVLEPFGLHL
ncbi:hypothetical protein D3C72_1080590 [compost metagenome]